MKKYKVILKTEQNKEAKKIENGYASKVLAVGSLVGLSSLP